jgi:myo-inositol 2-dehydrogenase/D-chiro-inositol 1-dehydrogenase
MAGTISVALLGLGAINATHQQILSGLPGVRIGAVWDPLPERARAVAAEIGGGCQAWADYRELLTRGPVDCAFIAIPPHRHSDHEVLAARRGLPFLVEKPIVRQLGQARAIEAEIARSGVLHAVGYHYRSTPLVQRARAALAGATVGLALGWTCWAHQTRESQAPWHAWLFDDAQGGGQVHEHTTHVLDLARFLAGDVRRVTASGARRREHDIPGYNTADVTAIQLEFENGALGQVAATHMTPARYWWGLNVLADRAIVEWAPRRLRVLTGAAEPELAEIAAGAALHAWQDENFIAAVRTGDPGLIACDYADAIKTAAVSLAALESVARGGEPVEVGALLARSYDEAGPYRVD